MLTAKRLTPITFFVLCVRRYALGVLPFIFISSVCVAETAQVARVIDGDTVVLEDGTRVRLIGIDAPEIENRYYGHRGDPYGEESKQVLKQMVEGKDVDLKDGVEKEDRYHRRLAYLYLPDQSFVNQNLVEVGAAEAYRKFPHAFLNQFVEIESQAKKKKIGMWAIEKKTPNWWDRLWGRHS